MKVNWEKYIAKTKEQEKMIKRMNYDLHIGHIRHNCMCKNCLRVLGQEKIDQLKKDKT